MDAHRPVEWDLRFEYKAERLDVYFAGAYPQASRLYRLDPSLTLAQVLQCPDHVIGDGPVCFLVLPRAYCDQVQFLKNYEVVSLRKN